MSRARMARHSKKRDTMDSIGVVVTGCSGRMGRMLLSEIAGREDMHLAGAVEREGSDWLGRDAFEAAGLGHAGVTVDSDPLDAFARAHAVVDFTAPEATLGFASIAAQARLVHVIGTTGMDATQIAALEPASRHATIIRAGNMSLGVNLLTGLTRKVAEALGEDWDVEITEAHHRHKVDAPSGTALMLGEAAAEGRGVSLDETRDSGRDGITGARREGAIGFSAIRGGDVVGEHDVTFYGAGERLTLRHVATDRGIFARGALRAALWGQGKAPGLYDMTDVLGL